MLLHSMTGSLLIALPLAFLTQVEQCGETEPDDRDAVTDGGTYYVVYTPSPDPIPVSERFAMAVSVAMDANHNDMATDASLAVDAWMPSMGHGMDTTARITSNGDGTFQVDNMEFSMTGEWEILMDVTRRGETESATFTVNCCE